MLLLTYAWCVLVLIVVLFVNTECAIRTKLTRLRETHEEKILLSTVNQIKNSKNSIGNTFLSQLPHAAETKLFLGSGVHTVEVYVANQKRVLIVDTGSGDTAFTCSECIHCGSLHMNPFFEPLDSTRKLSCADNDKLGLGECHNCQSETGEDVCIYGQKYVEGSHWDAQKVSELMSLEGRRDMKAKIAFGCIINEYGAFESQEADGIMGMSRTKDSIFNQFYMSGTTESRIFSQCISENGGSMVIGGVDSYLNVEPMQYTPLRETKYSYWTVSLESVLVNDKPIPISSYEYNKGRGCVLDSGTTFVYLPQAAERGFLMLWKDAVGENDSDSIYVPGKTYVLSQKQLGVMPIVCFKFRSEVKLCSTPEEYMKKVRGSSNLYVATIFFKDFAHATILGASILRNHNIAYDVDNHRIGIAKASCNDISFESALAVETSPGGHTFEPVYQINLSSYVAGVLFVIICAMFVKVSLDKEKDKGPQGVECEDCLEIESDGLEEEHSSTKYTEIDV